MTPLEPRHPIWKPQSQPSTRPHRVFVVEDHPVVSQGVIRLVDYEEDLEVCGTADESGSALEQILGLKPDLVILDLSLKGPGGLELLQQIKVRDPERKVLILSLHDESIYARRALQAGASGYVMKHQATDILLKAIREVLAGRIFLSERMRKKLRPRTLPDCRTRLADPVDDLTGRERQIFRLLGQGKKMAEIAELLGLRVRTVESHRTRIKDKLGFKSVTELIRHALERTCDSPSAELSNERSAS